MQTSVGFFHSGAVGAGGFRAGVVALGVAPQHVAAVLPALVRNPAGAAALTTAEAYPSMMAALLAVGWQDVNYLFENGSWYEVQDMRGRVGQRLAVCPPAGPEPATDAPEATGEQLTLLEKVTRSHVFEKDRVALRDAAQGATEAEASKLLDYILSEVKARKAFEANSGQRVTGPLPRR